jgi:DNA repair exonuclease SbcCD ATPase subunit
VPSVKSAPAAVRDVSPERLEQRCQVVQQKFTTHLNRYQLNTRQHTARYERMQARLNALVVRLNEAGKDTGELEDALAVFDQKIQLFTDNADDFMASLRSAQETACSDLETTLPNKAVETRSLLLLLKENVTAIKNYWQEIIRPMITALIAEGE